MPGVLVWIEERFDLATQDLLTSEPSRGRRFVTGVLWNWLGVLANLFAGLILSPILIRKLGPEGYGIWAFAFSVVEYYWLFDLGFRSATLKFVAHYSATGEPEKVSEVVSTALLYAIVVACSIMTGVFLLAPRLEGFFKISEAYHRSFHELILLTTLSWCLGMMFNLFAAALEGVQRYDLTNHVSILYIAVRSVSWATLLFLGYGLIPIGIAAVLCQCLLYGLNYLNFRHVFRSTRLSYRLATFERLKEMARFGIHTFVQGISTQWITQSPSVVIGHFMPVAFFGFYNLPVRLLQYTVDFVGRIGLVTNSSAAELAAKRDLQPLTALAIFTNRYCLVIFMPLAILLSTHGTRFFSLWASPEVAGHSAPLLPILLAAYVIAFVGQFSSGMLLQGLGRHQNYARSLAVEGLVVFAGLWFSVPRWGILGAAWVTSVAMILNRGLFTSWLVTRVVGLRTTTYLAAIYIRPFLIAAPAWALAYVLSRTILPGTSWFQFAAAGLIIGIVYYALAFLTCFDRAHRTMLLNWLAEKWRFLSPA